MAEYRRTSAELLACSPDVDRDSREADELARRALDSDPADPMALCVAALVPVMLHRDYQAGGDLIDRSLTINPNDRHAWGARGWISVWAGELDAAMTAFEKAMRLNPLDPQWIAGPKFGMASALCWDGRAEEALPWVRKALQDRPEFAGIHRLLVAVLWQIGRPEEAREAARRYVELVPGFSLRHARKVSPIRGTAGQERYFDALREAGLPE